MQCSHRALNPSREKLPKAWRGASRTCEPVRCYCKSIIHRLTDLVAFLPPPLPRYTLFACEVIYGTWNWVISKRQVSLWLLANEWLVQWSQGFETVNCSARQIVPRRGLIVPHEICVKKVTADMMLAYYEFHNFNQIVKPQFTQFSSATKSIVWTTTSHC